jgi:protocatechuate 3,4-dioxygenase beta subunit
MSRNSLALILVLLPSAVAPQPHTPTPAGVVRGAVVNEEARPVAGATVWAAPVDVLTHKLQRTVLTDDAGRFTISSLEWGRYRVYAIKPADGYADTHWAIHDNGRVPTVEISPTAPTADVQVAIGPKAALLAGTITDAATGQPVPDPVMRVWHWTGDGADRDSEFASGSFTAHDEASGRYELLIPPGKEVGFEVSAAGYETWHYSGESGPMKVFPLNLPSGFRTTIDIKLQPLPK